MNKWWKYVKPHLLVQRRVPISTNVERNVEKCIIRLSGSFARIFFVCATYVLLRLLLFLHEKNIWTVVQGNEEKISEETKIFLWLPPSRITTHKWWFVNRIHYRSATKSDDFFIGFISASWQQVYMDINFRNCHEELCEETRFCCWHPPLLHNSQMMICASNSFNVISQSDDAAIGFISCQRLKNDGNHSYEETRFARPIDISR